VQAELHPIQLGQDVVREVESAVRADVDFRSAEDAKRCELIVDSGDLLGLPAQVVGVEPGDDTHVRRVVADGEVLVTELAGGRGHLEHGRFSVRPRRVDVQVAADVVAREQRRRLAAERLLAQLGRAQREAELLVDGKLVSGERQLSERLDVGARSRLP
jgi:hypothetical protein